MSKPSVKVAFSTDDADEEFARMWNDDAQYDAERGEERWVIGVGEHKTIDLDGLDAVKASIISGRVDVIGQDEPGARLEIANVRGDEVRVSMVDGTLRIANPQADGGTHTLHINSVSSLARLFRGSDRGSDKRSGKGGDDIETGADISLLVPRETMVDVNCVKGDVLVSGLAADAKLDTVSGTLLADGVCGDLKLDTMSGKVEARNHYGDVHANSMSGDVVVSGECKEVTLNSMSGSLYFDAYGTPEKVKLDAMSGKLIIRLGRSVHARYKVDAMRGKVIIDGQRFKTGMDTFKYEDGPQDAPVARIEANAMSGGLKVSHRDEDGRSGETFGAGETFRAGAPNGEAA